MDIGLSHKPCALASQLPVIIYYFIHKLFFCVILWLCTFSILKFVSQTLTLHCCWDYQAHFGPCKLSVNLDWFNCEAGEVSYLCLHHLAEFLASFNFDIIVGFSRITGGIMLFFVIVHFFVELGQIRLQRFAFCLIASSYMV